MGVTLLKSNIDSKITNQTAPGSIFPSDHGGLMKDILSILELYVGEGDQGATQPYLRLNYNSAGDARLYSVGNLSTLVNTGNGLAAYLGGNTNLGAFTAKHLTAKGGVIQAEGVTSDARIILNSSSGYAPFIRFGENSATRGVIGFQPGGTAMQLRGGATDMNTGTLAINVMSDGNVVYGGGTTNAGYKSDFIGTARFNGHVYTGQSSLLYLGTTNAYITGNGSGNLTLYAYNGAAMADYAGTFFNGAIASGAVTGAAIPRPLVVGSSTLSQCAAFQVVSTTRGFLPPKLDSTQRAAMTNLEDGVEIFNTTAGKKQTWVSGTWYDHF